MEKILLTGGKPTGSLHLGHYFGAFKDFAEMQNDFNSFFIISDFHMLITKHSVEEITTIKNNAIGMVKDAISMGVDPQKTTFYLQSKIENMPFLFTVFNNFATVERAMITPSLVQQKKHSEMDEVTIGLLSYPVMESADIFALDADVVPVGEDNVDHIHITQELVKSLNKTYNTDFKIPKVITTEGYNSLVGTDGKEKMSKSLKNAIYISDTNEEINLKIDNMKWSEDKEENIVLRYIDILNQGMEINFNRYISMGESFCKNELFDCVIRFLTPMRERLSKLKLSDDDIWELICGGSRNVSILVDNKVKNLKNKMQMVY